MLLMSARYRQAELAPNTCSSSAVDVHMYVLLYPPRIVLYVPVHGLLLHGVAHLVVLDTVWSIFECG